MKKPCEHLTDRLRLLIVPYLPRSVRYPVKIPVNKFVLLSAIATIHVLLAWSVPALTAQSGTRSSEINIRDEKNFIKALRTSLVKSGTPPSDANYILEPLIQHGLVTRIEARCSSPQLIPALAQISNLRKALKIDQRYFAERFAPKIPRDPIKNCYIGCDNEYFKPSYRSWLRFLMYVKSSEVLEADHKIRQSILPNLPIWHKPIRIASTNSIKYDNYITQALDRLQKHIPSLPIDSNSFPAPINQANAFVDTRGIICKDQEPCRPSDTRSMFIQRRLANGSEAPSVNAQIPAIFFGELDGGKWRSTNPILAVPISRIYGSSAFLRVDQTGAIVRAGCTRVLGIGTDGIAGFAVDGSSLRWRRATPEAERHATFQCVAAMLGAPLDRQPWSIRGETRYAQCRTGNAPYSPTDSQIDLLHEMYPE